MLRGARHETWVVVSAYLRSASWALEVLCPMPGHSAPPATSTTHKLVAQPRKVRFSFRKRSTDVEKAAQNGWRFATTGHPTTGRCLNVFPRTPPKTQDPRAAALLRRAPSTRGHTQNAPVTPLSTADVSSTPQLPHALGVGDSELGLGAGGRSCQRHGVDGFVVQFTIIAGELGGVGRERGDEAEARECREVTRSTKPPTSICVHMNTTPPDKHDGPGVGSGGAWGSLGGSWGIVSVHERVLGIK